MQTGYETCDDGNQLDGDDCPSLCKPLTCGDGVVEPGVEACDDGNEVNTDDCLSNCIPASCGDGFVQRGEMCDDGNTDNLYIMIKQFGYLLLIVGQE